MDSAQVRELFLQYCDESDSTFLSQTNVQMYLDIGYNRFRQYVQNLFPWFYNNRVNLNIATPSRTISLGAGGFDVYGSAPGNPRLVKIMNLVEPTAPAGTDFKYIWSQVSTLREVDSSRAFRKFFQQGSDLFLSEDYQGDLALYYVPAADVDWYASPAEFIDEFQDWHDLIAAEAWSEYSIRDENRSPSMLQERDSKRRRFVEMLQRRQSEGNQYVNKTNRTYGQY